MWPNIFTTTTIYYTFSSPTHQRPPLKCRHDFPANTVALLEGADSTLCENEQSVSAQPVCKITVTFTKELSGFRSDSGVLSSFYSYFTLTEPTPQRGPTPEEQEALKKAQRCIQDCHVEQLITESKFLRVDSLQELLKVRFKESICV